MSWWLPLGGGMLILTNVSSWVGRNWVYLSTSLSHTAHKKPFWKALLITFPFLSPPWNATHNCTGFFLSFMTDFICLAFFSETVLKFETFDSMALLYNTQPFPLWSMPVPCAGVSIILLIINSVAPARPLKYGSTSLLLTCADGLHEISSRSATCTHSNICNRSQQQLPHRHNYSAACTLVRFLLLARFIGSYSPADSKTRQPLVPVF